MKQTHSGYQFNAPYTRESGKEDLLVVNLFINHEDGTYRIAWDDIGDRKERPPSYWTTLLGLMEVATSKAASVLGLKTDS